MNNLKGLTGISSSLTLTIKLGDRSAQEAHLRRDDLEEWQSKLEAVYEEPHQLMVGQRRRPVGQAAMTVNL